MSRVRERGRVFIGGEAYGLGQRVDRVRELKRAEIEKLASRKGVRKIAVDNFLSTMAGLYCHEAYGNLALDARSYKWKSPTVRAIQAGIDKACKRGR